MPKSFYHSISQLMACDKFCAIINEIRNLIGIGINSYLS